MFSRRLLSLAFALLASGCSSSSSGGNGATSSDDDDSGQSASDDSGSVASGDDATTTSPDGGTKKPGADASSPHDAGTSIPVDASTSGDAGIAAVCAGLCGSLQGCAATLDSGAAQPCHCDVTGTQLLRADYVQALTNCVSSTIASNCSVIEADGGTDGVVTNCEQSVTGSIEPTAETSSFCKNLELGVCANAIPGCSAQVFIYSDPTVMAAASCLPDVPDADVDGGCDTFAACLNTAFTP
jgi:hypothetical protein